MGKRVRLREYQKADLRKIYDNPAGTRMAIISYAKKNAKTTFAAFLLLLHLAGPESVPNSQLPSTAQSRDQAAVLFNLAAKIVRLSPTLEPVITIRDTVKQLYCEGRGTLYRALSADASMAHGQSPIFAVHDELGQVRGPRSELFNAIENAMGAHDAPMSVVISTQAPTDADLLSLLIDDALRGDDQRIVVSLYTADPALDPFSEEAIRQANPAFGDFLNANEVLGQAKVAKRLPAQEALYRNYTLNQRVRAENPLLSRSVWEACGGPPDTDLFKSRPVYAGLDLSRRTDLTAMVLVCRDDDGAWHVLPFCWTPEGTLHERARRDRVAYDVWVEQGALLTTPGPAIDYEHVAAKIAEITEGMDIAAMAFDRWRIDEFKGACSRLGIEFPLQEFGQGYKDMSGAIDVLEQLALEGRLRHGMHPVLTYCVANTKVTADAAGNRKPDKTMTTAHIDASVGLIMALAVGAGTILEALDVQAMVA